MAKSSAWIAGVAVAMILFCVAGGSARGGLVLARGKASEGRVMESHTARQEIEAFNRKFIDAHLKMDNAAVMSMWADDGVSMLPATSPMVGKRTIAKFLEDVVAKMPGYHMRKIEIDFQGIETSGDWVSEWATEHQIVEPPPGKEVFEGYGRMLLVLHKEADGNWRITREMWNQGEKPQTVN